MNKEQCQPQTHSIGLAVPFFKSLTYSGGVIRTGDELSSATQFKLTKLFGWVVLSQHLEGENSCVDISAMLSCELLNAIQHFMP